MMRLVQAVALLLLLIGCRGASEPSSLSVTPTPPLMLEQLFPRDGIVALNDLPALSAAEAQSFIASNDLVMGVVQNGEARAYPIELIARHELVNDRLGGQPILVTFCPLCNSGIAASRIVETEEGPRTLTFGISGQVLDDALVLYDHETESLWPQSRAAAISGPLVGDNLQLLASQQLPWSEWLTANPQTTVIVPPDGFSSAGPSFEVPMGDAPLPELPPNAHGYVIGVAADSAAIAFPLESIAEARLIAVDLAGVPLLVVAGNEVGAAWLWQAPANSDVITLGDDGLLRDEALGIAWDAATGNVVEGNADALRPVDNQLMHWQAWWNWHPDSLLWQL